MNSKNTKLMDIIMEIAMEILEAEAGSLIMIKEQQVNIFFSKIDNKEGLTREKKLFFEVVKGDKSREIKLFSLNINEGIAGWVAQNGKPLLVPDAQTDPRFNKTIDSILNYKTRTIICAPVQVRNETIGVIEIINKINGDTFTEKDMETLVVFANKISRILENNL